MFRTGFPKVGNIRGRTLLVIILESFQGGDFVDEFGKPWFRSLFFIINCLGNLKITKNLSPSWFVKIGTLDF